MILPQNYLIHLSCKALIFKISHLKLIFFKIVLGRLYIPEFTLGFTAFGIPKLKYIWKIFIHAGFSFYHRLLLIHFQMFAVWSIYLVHSTSCGVISNQTNVSSLQWMTNYFYNSCTNSSHQVSCLDIWGQFWKQQDTATNTFRIVSAGFAKYIQ